jgi:hypothetical protein
MKGTNPMSNAQAELFVDMPVCGRIRQKRRRICVVGFEPRPAMQLSFELVERLEFEDDDPLIYAPAIQRTVPASSVSPIAVTCASSVWALAFAPIQIKQKPVEPAKVHRKLIDTGKGFRAVRIMEAETLEWKEREIARRAKQTPPRPSQAMRTKSKRFKDLIGE